MKGHTYRPAVWILTVLVWVSPLAAQNLVENSEFDLDVSGWSHAPTISDLDWHTLDHDSCGNASGSALAENQHESALAGLGFETFCNLGIVGSSGYTLDGYLLIPGGQSRTGSAWISVKWYDSEFHCAGTYLGSDDTSELPSTNPDVWIHKRLGQLISPPTARSAQVRVTVLKSEAGGTLQTHYDGVHLVAGNGYLFGDGFECGSACRWELSPP
jgi:hypothetical protein